MSFNAAIKHIFQFFPFNARSIKLWILALFVAIIFSAAEVTFDGRRDFLRSDQYNHIMLSASIIESFKDGALPPRVSPILSDGLGNPYHQFYSPVSHTFVAVISFILRDLIIGFTVGSILLLALSFVYTFKLARYLTLSDHCAIVAAFMFVTAPYLSTDRVLRGAFAEYLSLCILPMVIYYNLRALHLRSLKFWLLAVLSSSVILQSHLLTGSFFLLFYAIIIISYCLLSLKRDFFSKNLIKRNSFSNIRVKRLKHIARKAFAASSIVLAAILLSMWYFAPVALYNDLSIKKIVLPNEMTFKSGRITPILSVLSVTDSSWNFKMNEEQVARFQTGSVLLFSYIAFVYICVRRRTTFALPFSLTVGFIFLLIVRATLFNYPPMKYIDIIQFSYRLLGLFILGATISGALVLKIVFRHCHGLTYASRTAFSLSFIALVIVAGSPYLYPRLTNFPDIKYMVNSSMILAHSKLSYGEGAYLRVPPPDTAGPEAWTDPQKKTVEWNGRAGDWRFSVDLQSFFLKSDESPGEMLLDVLYYPGLQKIDVTVDGIPVNVVYETYWQKRSTFGPFWEEELGSFHGLKLIGVPGKGLMEARVRFTGFQWANWISFITLIFLFLASSYLITRHIKK
jgi:hypothetical protein